ncbi:MAG TPA: glycosyltransferase [Holophaga sp.]|nr:glycosyltransferase [Holophaga sp.]
MTPLLSICIPTCDRFNWLKRCLAACLSQVEALPQGLVEVVVSNNASPDGTRELLEQLRAEHPALVVHHNETNNGCENFNTVVLHASGDYAWLMGDDDEPLPGAVSKVVTLLQEEPRDLYLLHAQEVDLEDRPICRRDWFSALPRSDWDLRETGAFMEYLDHANYMAGAFGFISVLVFNRSAWLEGVEASQEFSPIGWPHVANALQLVRRHGHVRVVEDTLVLNHAGNDGAAVSKPWFRAMWDLRGWVRLADRFLGDAPALHRAFMGTLHRNRGDGYIRLLRLTSANPEEWEEARSLLLGAAYSPTRVAAVEHAHRLLFHNGTLPSERLDPKTLGYADLGFFVRGSRRTLVAIGDATRAGTRELLEALTDQSHAQIHILHASGASVPMGSTCCLECTAVDLPRFSQDRAYQEELCDRLRQQDVEVFVNADPSRHPAWDLIASALPAIASVAFVAPDRRLAPETAAWLDSHYHWLLPTCDLELFSQHLGLQFHRMARQATGVAELPSRIHKELPVKLNLGCGGEHLPGWVNVDKFPAAHPDVVHDLEKLPWPFADDSAEEVLLKHVLEHLGRDSDTFLGIIRELYRVCRPGATVRILVPHPRHQDFIQDPTHVRPVVPEMFQHFSLAINQAWAARGLPGTPLAQYLGVDFDIVSSTLTLDPYWDAEYRAGRIGAEELEQIARSQNNVVQTSEIVLRAVKPSAAPALERVSMRWEGSQFVYHSLAHVNRQICLGLLKSGRVDLSLIPYEPDQFDGAATMAFAPLAACVKKALPGAASVHVRHQWPPHFEPPAEGAWVMIQPWEFGGIPAQWVPPMRDLVDEIWVPTHWVKDCYVKSGIPAEKVAVVPNGVDTTLFTPLGDRFPLRTSKGFKFLFLGGTIYRKGIDVLLDVYANTFRASDDVCLVIKGQAGMTYQGTELDAKLAEIAQDSDAPEIEYRVEAMDESTLVSLYRACDAFVLPYRGEGFGLPIAEAMASGLPVIVTGRGAAMDFVTEEWAYLVKSEPRSIPTVDQFQAPPCGFWLEEPDPDSLAAHLRRAFEHPDEAREKGRKGRAYAMAELGWDKPVEKILERLQVLSQRVPCRQGLTGSAPAEMTRCLFHMPADPHSIRWIQVLLAYATAFMPGDAVALGLRADLASHDELGQTVVGVMQKAGYEKFPDVMLLEGDDEIREWAQSGGDVIDLEDRASWEGHPLLDRLERSLLLFEKR